MKRKAALKKSGTRSMAMKMEIAIAIRDELEAGSGCIRWKKAWRGIR